MRFCPLPLNLIAAAESKLKCQLSPNTEPKLMKNYQKLMVETKTFFSIGSRLLYSKQLVSEFPITFLCHLNL